MTTGAAAEIENSVTGEHAEPVVVNRQHSAVRRDDAAASAYISAVACAVARKEKPSYSEGTTATSAEPSRAARAASLSPLTQRTQSRKPSRSRVASATPPDFGLPTNTSSTSRSVRTFATASSSGTRPLSGTSALAVATTRPAIRDASSGGANDSLSTPFGMTRSRRGSTSNSDTMSSYAAEETVAIAGSRRTTRPCIRVNPYQRRSENERCHEAAANSNRRSMVTG